MTDTQQGPDQAPERLHADANDRAISPPLVPRSRRVSRWWRWPVRLLWSLLLLVTLLLVGARYGGIPLAMWQLDRWYGQQSPDAEHVYRATLGQWQLSLSQGELELVDFYLHHPSPDNAGARTGFERLSVSVDTALLAQSVWAMIRHLITDEPLADDALIRVTDVQFQGLTLAGQSHMEAASGPDGSHIQLAGLTIPLPEASQAPPPAEPDDRASLPLRLDQLAFDQWRVRWSHRDAQQHLQANIDWHLEQLALTQLDTRPGQPLSLTLKTAFNQFQAKAPKPANSPLKRDLSVALQQPLSLALTLNVSNWQQGQPDVSGAVELDQLHLTLLDDVAFELSHLGVNTFAYDSSGAAKLDQIAIHELALRSHSSPDTRINLYRYLVESIAFKPNLKNQPAHLTLDEQAIAGLNLSARLDQQNMLVGLDWLDAPAPQLTSPPGKGSALPQQPANPSDLPVVLKTRPVVMNDLTLALQHPAIQLQLSSPVLKVGAVDSDQVSAIAQSGQLVVERLALADAGVRLLQPLTLDWQVRLNDWLRAPRVAGQFQMQDLAVAVKGQPDLRLDRLSLAGIDASARQQALASLRMEGLVVRHPQEDQAKATSGEPDNTPLLLLKQLQVPEIRFEEQLLSTGIIEFSGAEMSVIKRANGQLAGFPEPQSDSQSASQQASSEREDDEPGPQAPAVTVVLKGVRQGADVSQLHWADRSVSPAYQADITLHFFEVGNINTGQFDFARSGLSTPLIPVSAVLGLDEFNRIRFKGKAGLADGVPAGEYTLDVEQLNMVPLSPYVTQAMGYRIQKGMLDLDVDLDIKQGKMDGKADITLQNSQFEPADDDIIASVSKQIAMPVETALSVLKDDDNNIHLEVPLNGPLDDPSVGLNDVLAQVSTTAVRSATLFYLKQSIQPYGALISLGALVADEVFAIRLDPLDYQPYHYLLTEKQDDYLTHVVELMHSKPDLELQVCPFYSAAEAAAPESKTEKPDAEKTDNTASASSKPVLVGVALAQARAVQVKQRLAAFKDEKQRSLARRVTLCAPQQGEKATVEMGF